MQSVGTRLREARIKKGYTLEEINARTRISLKNLNAIESDDLSKISSPFTYRSFVKQISDLVGLDHAIVAADALSASSTMPEPLVPGQEEEVYVRPHQFQQVKPKQNVNWLRLASVAGVAGVISLYFLWQHNANSGGTQSRISVSSVPASSSSSRVVPQELVPAAVAQPEQLGNQVRPATVVPSQPAVTPRQEVAVASQPAPIPGTEQLLPPAAVTQHSEARVQSVEAAVSTSAVDPEAAIHIELSAIQPTWLSISADGKTTYNGTLGAMKTMSFDGKASAQIKTANAGGVNIIFNGRALGPLGRRGQSRTFVFTKSGYEVVHGIGGSTIPRVLPTGG